MIIKNWIFGQVVELPDQEFNRIESNTEEFIDNITWEIWAANTFKKDRDVAWIATVDELQNIEDNLLEIANKFSIAYEYKTWEYDHAITHNDLNRWEMLISLANTYASLINIEYVGTFNVGEVGLI